MTDEALSARDIDFAVAAWREDGRWNASAIPARTALSVESLTASMRQLPGEGGVLAFVGIGDEFFIVVRQIGNTTRGLVSDGSAILDWPIADELIEASGLMIDDDELEEFVPAGDLNLLADFGMDETAVLLLCEEESLYPDDQVKAIAKRIGFGPQLATALKSR